MVLFVIGLGLADETDITLKGLDAIKSCSRVYLEAYTSVLLVDKSKLEALYGKPVTVADREMVESSAETIFANADIENIAFLVVGDPFGATTHTDLILRAKRMGIKVIPIHNASIMNAIGSCGLQLYNYGQTISIVFFTDNWRPDSFYDRISGNAKANLHTLCLLDIKSFENMARGRLIYEPPRFMTINEAIEQLLEIEVKRGEQVYNEHTIAVGFARVGATDQKIVSGTLKELLHVDFGAPLHSLVLTSKMHFLEADYVKTFAVDEATFDKYAIIVDH